jgi:16S rRNA (adenine1518-N6/adenine1519-N6)-dimethyltransferase
VALADPQPGESVLEIGPGDGALTRELARHPSSPPITALEIDGRLADGLRDELGGRVEIRTGDVLAYEPEELLPDPGPWLAVTNAPYAISGALLRWLMKAAPRLERAVVMLQTEVVARLAAEPGRKDYGMLTVAAAFHFTIERKFNVSPNCFRPRPKVGSSVAMLTPHSSPPVDVRDADLLMRVMKAAFAQRRKTLRNTLRSATDLPGGESGVDAAIEASGVDGGIRSEQLGLADFARIADGFPRS